ncbi:ABC-type cobalamin/Fe(3+)-siderophores transport system ATPase component [Methanonatronarchaeum thermophilum]|uniref:ABC-type cobalamin/Fe(3+)-siderophores transport system ATPase component n=1 Tax=Methanonatronarchaeum thermophilum TaxID=1927129 RepID=A0A1Y3GAN0_9EURY|nr:ABC transporter ATP-binding protein [Methanonatronarchaeum thermophilum]OUJ18469.1 ABC-type cobalamin/Fe(3+)-siderophores transport system ATPase component [Methanonatronarchaeum thermophilum]
MVTIQVNNVNYDYNGHKVLKNINLNLQKGQVIGLLGPNGCGKTTLLKCISGILTPKQGDIKIDGSSLPQIDKKQRARKIGYVPQAEEVNFSITVFDTILMGRKPYLGWKPSKKDLKIVRNLINKFDLNHLAMRGLDELSGGQRQKVILARALAQKPKILVLDEPTNNLDIKHQIEMLNITRKQTKNNILVLIAIHDLNLAARYCDQIIIMKKGQIHASGGPETLSKKNIEPVYQIKIKIKNIDGHKIIIPKSEQKTPHLYEEDPQKIPQPTET